MRVWLITVGEPLPCDEGDVRPLRAGILAERLTSHGHDVVWWSSTFDHTHKRHRFSKDTHLTVNERLKLVLLHGMGYSRNISLARILNHARIARRFRRLAPEEQPLPDVILCSYPTIELCKAATEFGRTHGIPVVLDVRDLWPDIFLEQAPRWAAPAARMLLAPLFRAACKAFSAATAITGTTPEFVDWGLRKAGREGSELERDFPMGYVERPPPKTELLAGNRRWDKLLAEQGSEPFICCFFGTLGRLSDIYTVLDAADLCHAEGRNILFVLCGNGDYLGRYRKRAQGMGNVFFPGWVGHADIWTLMRRAKASLAPYVAGANYNLNIPNKPIEYLSAGLPVLTTITGVVGRMVSDHDCGLVYRHGDSEQLCAHLKALQDAPRRQQQMSRNALRLYRGRFRAEHVYGDMAKYLESVSAAFQT